MVLSAQTLKITTYKDLNPLVSMRAQTKIYKKRILGVIIIEVLNNIPLICALDEEGFLLGAAGAYTKLFKHPPNITEV